MVFFKRSYDTNSVNAKIFILEGIRVILTKDGKTLNIDYPYERKALDSTTVAKYIRLRIRPIVGYGIRVLVLDSCGAIANNKKLLKTLRKEMK